MGPAAAVNQRQSDILVMPSPLESVDFWITLAVLLGSAAVIGLMVWMERRPRVDFTPRLLPTTPIMLLSAFVGLLALVHLLNLYGIHTGRR